MAKRHQKSREATRIGLVEITEYDVGAVEDSFELTQHFGWRFEIRIDEKDEIAVRLFEPAP